MNSETQEGRIFFTDTGRSLEEEDEIELTSVGIDVGSSTSHMVVSRIVLERTTTRYIVAERTILHESDILLTPYTDDLTIDEARLGAFIDEQYQKAGVTPEQIDTGALILTGLAVRRRNARAIADLFAAQAGKFVSVSAGDGLESMLAAFGSGAVLRALRQGTRLLHLDIGGGTTKIAICEEGEVKSVTAIDIGARIITLDEKGRIARVEAAGERFARELGATLTVGDPPLPGVLEAIVDRMAERLCDASMKNGAELDPATASLLRLPPLAGARVPDLVTFSGGVSEYVYGRETRVFGDLGLMLAAAVRKRIEASGAEIKETDEGIRATVVGASQYTVQVSGSTVYVEPQSVLPLRNLPVVVLDLDLEPDQLDPKDIEKAVTTALERMDLQEDTKCVALFYRFAGTAFYRRMDAFVVGVMNAMRMRIEAGQPIVLVGEGDVGGLIGIHFKRERGLPVPIVSIDGISLKEFDFVDIGELLPTASAAPVVIKSLVFPASSGLGQTAFEPVTEIATEAAAE
ncbi:ethanolamine ammonia-lyase reactivating factor EutA [Burkholderia sp. Ax-1724]|uniref:ethanolamine ammonia-lyase reactivating factor EutA n=1 Tax=Burkholderia sp. Ax-1724 TaxID=2608336 RepID=UPI0014202377|nr:ethanolamine ammonia-lyase reactivating factor EutA [Burkholderia sp. Ax-1724]NIF55447.1 ethanolamine utilization protein EutA [Burkholderia sp. Ax-1724]